MSKTFQALSVQKVKTLLKKPGRHCDGGGLWLFVASEKSASWIFRYSRSGKQHDMGLGSARDVTLADARGFAGLARSVIAAGGDPMEDRRQKAARARLAASKQVTFKASADEYIAAHEASWANDKHRQQWRNTLAAYVHPVIGNMPVQDVDTDAVLRVLQPIWATKPETARRVRARIEMILDAAKAKDMREGPNPALWRGHLSHLLGGKSRKQRAVRNHPSLPYREMPAFMAARVQQGGVAALALRFAILTAARTSEVTGAVWTEINTRNNVWTVPGVRMKSGRDHRVPLSDLAMSVLEAAGTQQGGVFRTGPLKPALSNAAMAAVLARMGRSDVTVHGMRSSFRTWVRETRPLDRESAEAALAHAIGDKTEGAYIRGDLLERRRELMDAWADFCTSTPASAVVLPLHQAQG